MRNSLIIIAFASLFTSTTILAQTTKVKVKETENKTKTKTSMGTGMYTAKYSSSFQMGNSKYSAMVLGAWKAYDENKLENMEMGIADTATAILADGTVIKGNKEFANALRAYRGGFSKVSSTVDAWLPVRSIDKKEDVVLIWGTETDTKADGSTQQTELHEVWIFNKDGKLSFFKQYAGQNPKM